MPRDPSEPPSVVERKARQAVESELTPRSGRQAVPIVLCLRRPLRAKRIVFDWSVERGQQTWVAPGLAHTEFAS